MKKTLAIFLTIAMMSFMLVACGDSAAAATKEAKTTGIYLSPAQLSYTNMRPQYNYYLTTFTQQELTLMDDNTFCLIISSSCFSALELAESTNDAKGNERTNFITKIYGECTSKPNDLDEDLVDVTLGKITRVVKSYDQTYYVDTANWNNAMGKAVQAPTGYDQTSGAPIYDENAKPLTAEEYLATYTLAQTEIQVNNKLCSFDYTDFGF